MLYIEVRGAEFVHLPLTGSSAETKLEAVTPTVKGAEEMRENMLGRSTSCAPDWRAPSTGAATASSCWQCQVGNMRCRHRRRRVHHKSLRLMLRQDGGVT